MTREEKAIAYADRVFIDAAKTVTDGSWDEFRDTYAAAYLAGAEEALASPQELASQWVSVEERLPEMYEEVLIYRIRAIDKNTVAFHDGVNWYTNAGDRIFPEFWMPIPGLPEEGGKK